MTRFVAIPPIPRVPREYDPAYMERWSEYVRNAILLLRNPGAIQGTTLNLTALQDWGAGLRVGDVFIYDSRLLRIVQSGECFAPRVLMTASLGSVTVT